MTVVIAAIIAATLLLGTDLGLDAKLFGGSFSILTISLVFFG